MNPRPVLALDAALDGCLAGVVVNGQVLAERRAPGGRGSAAALPALAARVLREAGLDAGALASIAVTVGPGSFTGVRAALALAQGIGLATAVPVVGVTVGDAIRADAAANRPVWVAIGSRRSRIFLDTPPLIASLALDDLPTPPGPVAIAGDAAVAVLSRLAARGADVQLLSLRACSPAGIAEASALAPRPPLPLYIDPVAARPNLARPNLARPNLARPNLARPNPALPPPHAPISSTIIPATRAHGAAMAAIHEAAFPPGARWGPDAMSLQLALPGAFGFIDAEGGLLLARVAADEAEILTLAVAPAMHRRGIARRLLSAAMAHAAEAGAAAMLLEVGAANPAAQALYAQAGFTEAGRRPRYYVGGEDAIILRANLPSSGSAP